MKKYLILATLIFSTNSWSGANGWSGNGGDTRLQSDNIWNLGAKPVHYCIEKSDEYPFSTNELNELVEESFKDWVQFLKKYQLDQNKVLAKTRFQQVIGLEEGIPNKISTNYVRKEKCQAKTDIKFLFGKKNQVIQDHQNHGDLELNYGLAIRPGYNHESFRNGGYIWIADFTSSKKRLKHVILHEIGHVLGMRHDSVFVMNSDMALLLRSNALNDDFFGTIESNFWHYNWLPGEKKTITSFLGRLPLGRNKLCKKVDYQSNIILPLVFRLGMGINKQGCHKLELNYNPVTRQKNMYEIELIISTLDGSSTSIRGVFTTTKENLLKTDRPGVFTKMADGKWRRGVIDHSKRMAPARGFFQFKGKKYPAIIKNEKGLSMEIFLYNTGRWWVQRPADIKAKFNQN